MQLPETLGHALKAVAFVLGHQGGRLQKPRFFMSAIRTPRHIDRRALKASSAFSDYRTMTWKLSKIHHRWGKVVETRGRDNSIA